MKVRVKQGEVVELLGGEYTGKIELFTERGRVQIRLDSPFHDSGIPIVAPLDRLDDP